MAKVFVRFETVIAADDGATYHARACGAPMPDGLWEGWIEFIPEDGGKPLRTQRETTQPNRKDTVYWATGLTPVYLAGALARALNPVVRRRSEPPPEPAFTEPAPGRAVLDPFAAYEKGETLLRQELHAMSADHLVNIIRGYELSDRSTADLNQLSDNALVELIITEVRRAAMKYS